MAQEQAISVPLLSVNQKAPQSAGPVGRLEQISNGIVVKTQNGEINVQKRDGFAKLSLEVRTPVDGTQESSSGGVPSPTLLAAADAETRLVAIDNMSNVYRYNVERPCWEQAYGSNADGTPSTQPSRVIPLSLQTSTVVSRNTQTTMPGLAIANGLRCYVWGEGSSATSIPAVTIWCKIVDAAGVQVRAPFLIGTQNSGGVSCRIRVTTDGTNFWIFYDIGTVAVSAIVLDGVTGVQLAGRVVISALPAVGFHWDIMLDQTNGITLAAAGESFGSTVGFRYMRFSYAAATITTVIDHDASEVLPSDFGPGTIDGGLGWLKNNTGDGKAYLACLGNAGGEGGPYADIYVYRLNNDGTTDHQYIVRADNGSISGVASVTGFVVSALGTVIVSWTQIMQSSTAAFRDSYITTKFCTTSDFTGVIGVQRAAMLASRVMTIGGRWVVAIWYPSQLTQFNDPNASSVTYGTQPAYFLYSIADAQIVGQFANESAVMDWAIFGFTPSATNVQGEPWFFWLADAPFDEHAAHHVPLVELYQRFATSTGVTIGGFGESFQSATLITDMTIGAEPARAAIYAAETVLPGLAAIDEGDLSEQGFWLAPEPPACVEYNGVSGGMTAGQTYQYILTFAAIDARGDLVQSQTSLFTQVTLTAGFTAAQLTIPTLRHTRHSKVLINITRTYVNAANVMSTDHRSIYPLAATIVNDPTADSIVIIDTVSDLVVSQGRPLYADPTATPVPLDYWAPPPFTVGDVFANRLFVVGYDGSVWFSMEKVDGQAIAFSPFLRIILPSAERIRSIAAMDGFLVLGCDASIWIIENTGFPDATGNGNIPTPQQLPFPNGMASIAKATKDGVFYVSSAGGLWMIGRDLSNNYVGAAVEDDMIGTNIVDIVIDQNQRVAAVDGVAGKALVWDSVVQQWYTWTLPEVPYLACSWRGNISFGSLSNVWQQVPGTYVDDAAAIQTKITVAPMAFASVPGLQMVWMLVFLCTRLGRHMINVSLFYDDATQSTEAFAQDSDSMGIYYAGGAAYRFEVPPANAECGAIAATIFDTFPNGASAGFALENIGAILGIVPGARRINISQRIAG